MMCGGALSWRKLGLVAIVLALGLGMWPPAASADASPIAVDVARSVGIDFVHAPARSELPRYPDMIGGGACWGDHDQDGLMDLYLPNTWGPTGEERSRLYHNMGPDGDGWRFTDVSEKQGVALAGMGQGCTWGDYDNDGWPDLFVTFAVMADSARGHTLLRNLGDGRGFEDVTLEVGMDLEATSAGEPLCLAHHRAPDDTERSLCFGVSAAWLDHDLDGDLDLYVGNYVDVPHGACRYTSLPNPVTCQGQRNHLWRNDGGIFHEIGMVAGVAYNSEPSGGRTLGVVATDIDGDTWPDIYTANDYDANGLFINERDGTFREVALDLGVAARGHTFVEENGHRAGMGIDAQDIDDDGRVDLLSTHLKGQYDAIYLGTGKAGSPAWKEIAEDSDALTTVAKAQSRWGGGFIDLDLDGRKDYFVVGGHQYNHEPGAVHLARQTDDGLELLTAPEWPYGEDSPDAWRNHRSAAYADYDNDGDLDLLVGVLETRRGDIDDRRPRLLRFDVAGADGPRSVRVVLEGTDSGRDAFGAHVIVETDDGRRQHMWKTSGASYGSGHDPRLLFGLGDQARGTVTVVWPGGSEQGPVAFDLGDAPTQTVRVVEENTRPPAMPAWTTLGDDGVLRWAKSLAVDFAAYRVYDGNAIVAELDDRDTTTFDATGEGPYRVTVVDTGGFESTERTDLSDGSFAALPGIGPSHGLMAGLAAACLLLRRRR